VARGTPSGAIRFARSWCSPYPSSRGGYYSVARRSASLSRPLIALSVFPGLLDRPLDLDLGAFDPAFELMARIRIGSLAGGTARRSVAAMYG
jgi:hypothetical protein